MSTKSITTLAATEILRLMRACVKNAETIRADADLLSEHERYARAAYLYAVALEELGKVLLLGRSAEIGDDQAQWRSFWKQFTDHEPKLIMRIAELPLAFRSPGTGEPHRLVDAPYELSQTTRAICRLPRRQDAGPGGRCRLAEDCWCVTLDTGIRLDRAPLGYDPDKREYA